MRAYLADLYRYRQQELANAPASKASLQAAESKLGSECAGVLDGMPREPSFRLPPEEESSSARQRGEAKRVETQLEYLEYEVTLDLEAALAVPDRAIALAFAGEVRAIHWGEGLRDFGREEALGIETATMSEPPASCSDMKSWAASGFKLLSPSSRVIAQRRETQMEGILHGLQAKQAAKFLSALGLPGMRELLSRITKLDKRLRQSTDSGLVSQRLDPILGLPTETREPPTEEISHPQAAATMIGSGTTAAGTRYALWLKLEREANGHGCLTVEYQGAHSIGTSSCVGSGGREAEAGVRCEQGLLVVQSRTLPATRRVTLHLSNGRQVTSRPVLVPRRFGRHVEGFYYQAVRGPSPIPQRLTELDAHGRRLRVVKLQRVTECTKNPIKYVHGGVRTLARGRVPRGPGYEIAGERYRELGRSYFELTLAVGFEEQSEIGKRHGGFLGTSTPSHPVPRGPFEQEVRTGCHPYEYAIVYGLLRDPRDSVFVEIAGRLQPLRAVRIPPRLHAGGVLVSGAFALAPEAIVVRSPGGKTVQLEDRHRESEVTRETCEGEAEGAGPTVGGDEGSGGI